MTLEVDAFGTTTVAILVFLLGSAIVARSRWMRDFGIPDSVVGGLIAAIVVASAFFAFELEIGFDSGRRDLLLAYFFSALGLRARLGDLWSNGRPLLMLVALAAAFILVQNGAGMAIASALGHDPKLGIVTGSMALIGRSGTTVAWAPVFEERFGLEGVSRIGVAASMLGMIAASCIGGPLAKFLIGRYRLVTPGPSPFLDVGTHSGAETPKLDYRAFLLALLRINVVIIVAHLVDFGLTAAGAIMPLYVSCLLAGIALGNVKPRVSPTLDWRGSDQILSLIADVSLGLFYTMTLMSMQLWNTQGLLGFLLVMVAIQALLAAAYISFLVFPVMGRDYEAAVMAGGFAGLSLGSTGTTLAIMTAVAKQYGRAPKAFLVVPLACGIFIDIVNSLAIAIASAP